MLQLHPTLTPAVIDAAMDRRTHTLDDPGFCIACGHEHLGIEPDARELECESCGANAVYGVYELWMELD